MSTCISSHGEYSSHKLDATFTCTLCGVLDKDALRAELVRLRAEVDRMQQVAEKATDVVAVWRQWQRGQTKKVIPIKALAVAVDVLALGPVADALSASDGAGQTDEPRAWRRGDAEPEVSTRLLFGGEVWIRHHQHLWVCEFSLGTGALGIEWYRLLEAAGPTSLKEACASQYPMINKENDSRCRLVGRHDGLHQNRAGFAWDEADLQAAHDDLAAKAAASVSAPAEDGTRTEPCGCIYGPGSRYRPCETTHQVVHFADIEVSAPAEEKA